MNSFLSGPIPTSEVPTVKSSQTGASVPTTSAAHDREPTTTTHPGDQIARDATRKPAAECAIRHRYSSLPLRFKYRLFSNPVKPDSMNSTQNRLSENALRR